MLTQQYYDAKQRYDELAFDSIEYNRWCYNECATQNQHPKSLHNKMHTNNENAHHLTLMFPCWF